MFFFHLNLNKNVTIQYKVNNNMNAIREPPEPIWGELKYSEYWKPAFCGECRLMLINDDQLSIGIN